MSNTNFNFDKVKKHLSTINDSNDKIKYLVEVKTKYLQELDGWNLDPVPFDKKCDLEITKIRTLETLESKKSKK